MTTNPNHITRQQLADLIGARAPSYVNELEKNGRAVRAPDGKLWLKAESLAAYRAGKDPSKQGVADRHAAARSAAAVQAEQQQKQALAPVNADEVATKSVANTKPSAKTKTPARSRKPAPPRWSCAPVSRCGAGIGQNGR